VYAPERRPAADARLPSGRAPADQAFLKPEPLNLKPRLNMSKIMNRQCGPTPREYHHLEKIVFARRKKNISIFDKNF
jgi:hypothetical protein